MGITEQLESAEIEASLHQAPNHPERLDVIYSRVHDIHGEIATLNRELGSLSTEAYGIRCETVRMSLDGQELIGSSQPSSVAHA